MYEYYANNDFNLVVLTCIYFILMVFHQKSYCSDLILINITIVKKNIKYYNLLSKIYIIRSYWYVTIYLIILLHSAVLCQSYYWGVDYWYKTEHWLLVNWYSMNICTPRKKNRRITGMIILSNMFFKDIELIRFLYFHTFFLLTNLT